MAEIADYRALKQALGRYPTGVAVVTALGADGEPVGLTVNSFTSVSLQPPLILWCLDNSSPNLAVFEGAAHFAVNVLAAEQGWIATRFAKPVEDKFGGIDWRRGDHGLPVLTETVACLTCRTYSQHPGGDHVILLGEVETFADSPGDPLVYVDGTYQLPRTE